MSGLCWLTQWIDFLQNKRFFVPNDSVYILSLEFALDCTRTWNHYKQLSHLKPVSHRRIKTLNRSSSYLQRINSLPFVVEIVHKMHFVEKKTQVAPRKKILLRPGDKRCLVMMLHLSVRVLCQSNM